MKLLLMTAVLCGALAIALGVPVPAANPEPEPVAAANPEPAAKPKTDIELMKIPLDGDQELDVITLVNSEDQRINERNKRTIGILRELFPSISQITTNEDVNTLDTLDLAGLSDTLNAIRVARATAEEKAASSNDQNAAESSANSSSLDELTLDSEGTDEDRNKRFLSFGGSSGGGGSGNFLFDIIRRAADRAARAAGTVYRVVAGTESLTTALETTDHNNNKNNNNHSKDDGHSTSYTATSYSHSALVSGSSGTEQSDEKAHSPDDHDLGKGDGYTEGIPGPVTRLFVLANRGLSNLIQDLILPSLLSASMPAALPALPNMTALLALVPPLVPTNPLDMGTVGNLSQLEAELTSIIQPPALAAIVPTPPQLGEALGSFITALAPPAVTTAAERSTVTPPKPGKPAPSGEPDVPERMSLLPFSFF
ncbi:uncharacterized protein LOC118460673 isoform X5 [Anopheles albimanus]|uniref:uncharacterized protein LOC118460673 isoform X5 n=1 Tax=Anopheles albimanus TaxID=7167 RepID=UPI001640BC99|nr:uncharacterized protein LOC118460673 isoform X5 [Anopheles albimanus]